MANPSSRPGFNRIGLIVVVLVIVVVTGMLIPSVERVRGAAARMQCSNNMKQIGIACHNYAEANGRLPGGSIVDSAKEPTDRLGVLVSLLPYVEQDNLYKQLDLKRGWAEQKEAEKSLRIYRCPIDKHPESANHTNYVAIAGVDPAAAMLPLEHARAGAFGFDRVVLFADIRAGTSNTLLFLETHQDTGPWASAGHATLRGIDPDDETPIGEGRAFGVRHDVSGWSWGRKPGECNATMADGSVRSLTPRISAETLSALATIAGGEDMAIVDW